MERLKELIDRMVAPGPAFAHLSASEGHEIREGCLSLIKQIGTPSDEPHLCDPGPRAETWHQERQNWSDEVIALRAAYHRLHDAPGYIEFSDENGTYRISRENPPITLDDVIEDMVIPVLLAAGYSRQSINDYYIPDPNL